MSVMLLTIPHIGGVVAPAPEPEPDSFDFGLPFFFGVNVFTAIADQSTPGGTGPYVAF